MRKPHARLAHANWLGRDVYSQFRSEWHHLTAVLAVPWKQTEWTAWHNEQNWECILRWRLKDAFELRSVSVDVAHAFEAILLADHRGETLPLAYAYATGVIRSWRVSAPEEQHVGGGVAEGQADGAEPDHAHGLAVGITDPAERT